MCRRKIYRALRNAFLGDASRGYRCICKKSRRLHGSSGSNGPAKHEGTRKAIHYTHERLLRFVGWRQVPVPFRQSSLRWNAVNEKACSRITRAGKKTDQHSRHEGCPGEITARRAQTLAESSSDISRCCVRCRAQFRHTPALPGERAPRRIDAGASSGIRRLVPLARRTTGGGDEHRLKNVVPKRLAPNEQRISCPRRETEPYSCRFR